MGNENFENDDTEYQFHENEDVTYEEEEDIGKKEEPELQAEKPIEFSVPPRKNPLLTKKKLIAFIVFALLGVLIIYKLVTLIFGGFKSPQPPPKALAPVKKIESVAPKETAAAEKKILPAKKTEEGLAALISPETPSAEEAAVKKPPAATTKTEGKKEADSMPSIAPDAGDFQGKIDKKSIDIGKLDQQISVLQEKSAELKQSLDDQKAVMQSRLSSLESSIADLRSGIEALEDNVQSLSYQVRKATQLITVSAKKQITMGAEKAEKMRVRKKYFVEAVIPGRAWIRGADGSTNTVTVGDYIEGYGRVTAIDAYSGTVTTSSGVRIYYGVNG